MSRRAILALSAAVSAFVLVLAGAVAVTAWRPSPAPSASPADTVPAEVVRAREAEYRRMLDEANARLRDRQAATVAAAPSEVPRSRREHQREHREHEHGREHDEDDDG